MCVSAGESSLHTWDVSSLEVYGKDSGEANGELARAELMDRAELSGNRTGFGKRQNTRNTKS